jgi:putative SOS response-associated peptidase YedK
MCGRFSQSERPERLAELFGADPTSDDLPSGKFNTAPTDPIRIVVHRDGRRLLTAADWGFRPFWLDRSPNRPPNGSPRNGTAPSGWINARAETALDSTAFGPALRSRRCVIPADAFYEWRREVRPPQPFAIGPADGRPLFAFAGIWTDASAERPPTAAILTTEANAAMRPLHHRMPVLLDEVDAWLDPDAPMELVASLLVPAPDAAVRMWAVSTAVNSVRNDGPELLRPMPPATGLFAAQG